jgi:hypothetical protein
MAKQTKTARKAEVKELRKLCEEIGPLQEAISGVLQNHKPEPEVGTVLKALMWTAGGLLGRCPEGLDQQLFDAILAELVKTLEQGRDNAARGRLYHVGTVPAGDSTNEIWASAPSNELAELRRYVSDIPGFVPGNKSPKPRSDIPGFVPGDAEGGAVG